MADDTAAPRQQYLNSMVTLREDFSARAISGVALIHARAAAADALVRALWQEAEAAEERLRSGIAVLAVGG